MMTMMIVCVVVGVERRRVGSIADYDPINERYGSLTQGYQPTSRGSQSYEWQETYSLPQHTAVPSCMCDFPRCHFYARHRSIRWETHGNGIPIVKERIVVCMSNHFPSKGAARLQGFAYRIAKFLWG